MSDRFVKNVNKPIKKLAEKRKQISKQPAQNTTQSVLKAAQVSGLAMTQAMYWLFKYILLTNKPLRMIEDKLEYIDIKNKSGKRNPIKALHRRFPNVSVHLWYYMILAAATYGTANTVFSDRDGLQDKQESVVDEVIRSLPVLDADAADFIQQALDAYWNDIGIGLTELETYRATPKRHGGESRMTNGLGSTWTYTRTAQGAIVQSANEIGKTATNSKQENYEQVKLHLEKETLPSLRNALRGRDKIDGRQSVALVYAGYQRPSDMKHIAARIQDATTQQDIADAFQYTGNMSSKWKEGTLKRRWICAAYAVGAINSDDLKNMCRDAFSRVELNNILRNGHFLLDAQTVKYVLSRVNGNNTVAEFLSDFELGRQILNNVRPEERVLILQTVSDPKIEKSMKLLNQAEDNYAAKQYKQAAQLYEQAIAIDPDNMEAYSSLALVYKKLGDENSSVDYYQKTADVVRQCNGRMNANKSLLFDHVVKAATYYNAGQAREAMADLYKQQGNLSEARKNYTMAQKNYENALLNIQKVEGYDSREAIYQAAFDKMKKLGSKKLSFNGAQEKLNLAENRNASKQIIDYERLDERHG